MNSQVFASSIKNIHDFSQLIEKWKIDVGNNTFLDKLSDVNWKFIDNANADEIRDIIITYSNLLISQSFAVDCSNNLAYMIIKNLRSVYTDNSLINHKPILIVIWKLYYANPCMKESFKKAIGLLFPHNTCKENVLLAYIKCLLDLVSPIQSGVDSSIPQLAECENLFLTDFQQFVISELTTYIIDIDSMLTKSEFMKPTSELREEFNNFMLKLDSILCLTFDWIKSICYSNNQLNWPNTQRLYKYVRRVYIDSVMPLNIPNAVFHSHTVLAYLTSFHPDLAKATCEYLWTLTTDTKQTISTRTSAAVNLCAYIAKFNFVPVNLLTVILTTIFTWCNEYAENFVDYANCTNKDHSVFFELCNGAFYAFLHRHKEIIDQYESVTDFGEYADRWQLFYLTQHPAVVLRDYPFRDQLSDLSKLIKQCYLGYIDAIIEEKVLTRRLRPTKLAAMPFRFFFLPNSVKYITQYRVPQQKHDCIR